MPQLKSEWFGSHICAYFHDQKETDIDEQMRPNHFIHGVKKNQFHIFAHYYGWKETDFYEQMTQNWRWQWYMEEPQLMSFWQKRNQMRRKKMIGKFEGSDDDFEDWQNNLSLGSTVITLGIMS